MPYQFNITTTDSKIISKTLELEEEMTIKDLKIKLVGPIISTVGFDKVKFFQTGKQFTDENKVSDFNDTERILIFPMIPSIRSILISSFEDDDISDDETPEKDSKEDDAIPSPVEEDEEEEPKLELKSSEEVIEEIQETLNMFSKPSISKLMEIYLKNKEEFMEFITYISKGSYNEVSADFKVEYPQEIYDKIRTTFDMFKDKSNQEIKHDLDKYGGNLDILILYSLDL